MAEPQTTTGPTLEPVTRAQQWLADYDAGKLTASDLYTRCLLKDLLAVIDARVSVPSIAPPNHALVQLLEAALLHPESADGNIRQVIAALSAPASTVASVEQSQFKPICNDPECWVCKQMAEYYEAKD